MHIELYRDTHCEYGTFGQLVFPNGETFETVEPTWGNNVPFESCVPCGIYELEYHKSPKHGDTYIFYNHDLGIGKYEGDAKRDGCLIHIANLASQLEGCIAPGFHRAWYKNNWSVKSSGLALKRILELLGKEEKHTLAIIADFPTFEEESS